MRVNWNGSIAFALVNVPVKTCGAAEDRDVEFHQVHAAQGVHIHKERRLEVCGKKIAFERFEKAAAKKQGIGVKTTAASSTAKTTPAGEPRCTTAWSTSNPAPGASTARARDADSVMSLPMAGASTRTRCASASNPWPYRRPGIRFGSLRHPTPTSKPPGWTRTGVPSASTIHVGMKRGEPRSLSAQWRSPSDVR